MSLGILRDFGVGKNLLADKIQEEITHSIRAIEDHQGAPVDLHSPVSYTHLTLPRPELGPGVPAHQVYVTQQRQSGAGTRG